MLIDNKIIERPLYMMNGVLMYFDPMRIKYLSVDRQILCFGLDNKNIFGKRWLSLAGKVYSNCSGYNLLRNACITAVSVQTQLNTTCMFSIKRNNNEITLLDIILNNESSKIMDNLNFDLQKGDFIQVEILKDEVTSSNNLNYPELILELAWRQAD